MSTGSVVKSVGRVFAVLERFKTIREPLSSSELADALGYPKSSTIVLLKSMAELGYLAFDYSKKTYFPTPRVADLGNWISPDLLRGGVVDQVMQRISIHTKETVYLAVQRHLMVNYQRVYPGLHPIALTISEGSSAPLFGSAIGKALLSIKQEDELARLVGRETVNGSEGALDLGVMREALEQTRALGYGIVLDSFLPGAGAIAFALSGLECYDNYAIGVGGPSERIRNSMDDIVAFVSAELAEAQLVK